MARTPIDFTNGLSEAEVITRNDGGHNSVWISVLADLVTGVTDGPGEYDTLYMIGEFGNASGARTTIRNLSARDDLPGEFDMHAVVLDVRDDDGNPVYEDKKVKTDDGTVTKQVVKRTSELWAAVASPKDDDEGADDDEPDDDDGENESEGNPESVPDDNPEPDDDDDDEPEDDAKARAAARRKARRQSAA